ncbi:flagellar brake protein [Kaarinaea lacus]
MVRNLFKNPLTSKKDNKTGFKPISKYIKCGDLVLFTQGSTSIETKVLELSSAHILLDDTNRKLNAGKDAVIYNFGEGEPWRIRVPSFKRVKEGKDQYIRCDNPEKIELLNRRDNFRATIPLNKRYFIRFAKEERTITARLIDVSVTGAQVELSTQESEAISVENHIDQAMIQMEGIFKQPLGFTVKWKKTTSNHSRLGIAFDEIPQQERSVLSKLIFQLERELA